MSRFCSVCKVILIETNWRRCDKKNGWYICKDCFHNKRNEDYKKNLGERRKANRRRNRRYTIQLKQKVIRHYSNGTMACANPFRQHEKPYTDIRALSIDHPNGGGNQQRKKLKGSAFYRWLIKNNYPEGYQVLCGSCQMIKKWENFEFRDYIHDESLK